MYRTWFISHPVVVSLITVTLLFPLQEFFTEDLWHTLPSTWQPVLQDLSYPQIADLLLDATHGDRRYHWIVILQNSYSKWVWEICWQWESTKYCQQCDNDHRQFVITDILQYGPCLSWRSVPRLTLWHFPESAGRSAAGQPARWSLRSSWKTKVRAHCWDTYSGNTSNPRNNMRSASWARYRIDDLLLSLFLLFLRTWTCFYVNSILNLFLLLNPSW